MLTLPIKKKWFDMVRSGEKKEEYREIKPYYTSRFTKLFGSLDLTSVDIAKPILFRNGYNSSSPSFIANCSFSIKTGKEEWGAEPGKEYYVLTIKEILDDREVLESETK